METALIQSMTQATAIMAAVAIAALAVRFGVKKYLARKRIDDRLEQVRGWKASPEEMANWAELMRGVEEAHTKIEAKIASKERKAA